jgi:hypothetical protein
MPRGSGAVGSHLAGPELEGARDANGKRLSEAEREQRRADDRRRLDEAARQLLSSAGWQRWIRVRARNGLGGTACLSRVPDVASMQAAVMRVDGMSLTRINAHGLGT